MVLFHNLLQRITYEILEIRIPPIDESFFQSLLDQDLNGTSVIMNTIRCKSDRILYRECLNLSIGGCENKKTRRMSLNLQYHRVRK
jgi:hypothetical protein